MGKERERERKGAEGKGMERREKRKSKAQYQEGNNMFIYQVFEREVVDWQRKME